MPEGKSLEHKTLKAVATTKDQGHFTAIAATYSVDRTQEQIVPGAFEKTIKAWQESQKMLPLHWDHEGSAQNVIGFVDPAAMQETKDGLYVEGQLDLENSEVAKEAWRSMKNNAVSLSFGYLAETKTEGNVTKLTEIDLFEVSIVPAPANNDTRLLSLKTLEQVKDEAVAEAEPDFKSVEEVQTYLDEKFPGHQILETSQSEESDLRKRSLDVVLETANDFKTSEKAEPEVEPEPEPEPEPIASVELRRLSERAVIDAALL